MRRKKTGEARSLFGEEPANPATSLVELGEVSSVSLPHDDRARLGRYLFLLALLSLLAAALVTFFFCPRFRIWRGLSFPPAQIFPEVRRAVSTLEQIQNPFAPVADPVNRPIAWRLLFPVLWHYLALPYWLFLTMPQVGCLLALALIAHIVFQATGDRRAAFLTTIMLGAAPWFWVSEGWLAYFDSWLIGGLLVFTFAKPRLAVVLTCLLIPWIDERFLLGAPLCFLIRTMNFPLGKHRRPTREIMVDAAILFLSSLAYIGLRITLAQRGLGGGIDEYVKEHLDWARLAACPPARYLEGIWMALRAGWFIVLMLLWSLWVSKRRLLGSALVVVLLGTIAVALVIAVDIHRSICVVLPVALAGVLILARDAPRRMRMVLPAVAVANLLLPGAHVLTGRREPIFYVYVAISWQNLPPVLSPAAWTQNGFRLVQENKFEQAETSFDNALKLDGSWGPAYLGRTIARINLGNLEGAAQDAEHAVRCLPDDSNAYHARAVLRMRRGNRLGAAEDLRTALKFALPDWPRLQESQNILNTLSSGEGQKGHY